MALAVGTFPQPRANRVGPAPAAILSGAAAPAIPSARIIPIAIGVNQNSRSSEAVGPLRGPGIIRFIEVSWQNGADPPNNSFEVGYSTAPLVENNVAETVGKLWTPIFTPFVKGSGYTLLAFDSGILPSTQITQLTPHTWPIEAPVALPEWYVVVSAHTKQVAGTRFVALVHILEGVSPQALANFP
ncbi:MAG: hypothetical protein ACRD0K_19400 [Egibacteraceae bacterium]